MLEDKTPYLKKNEDKNYIGLFCRNHEARKSKTRYFVLKEKKKLNQNSVSNEIILQKLRNNKDSQKNKI